VRGGRRTAAAAGAAPRQVVVPVLERGPELRRDLSDPAGRRLTLVEAEVRGDAPG